MVDRLNQRVGSYHLIRLLGDGSFSTVYLGEHVRDKTQAAVKILKNQPAPEHLQDVINEVRLFRLKHPNIVQLLDVGVVENTIPFFVTQYASGGTLRQQHPRGTQLSLSTISSYVTQIASALQYVHDQRLIHRDIKPENIFIGNDHTLLVGDFGIAAEIHSLSSFGSQNLAGTVPYLAPEQSQGKACAASDQYALGIMVYEWLCGQRPFNGTEGEIVAQHLSASPPSLCKIVSTISPEIEHVVFTALAKDPDHRFPSIEAFARAFEHAATSVAPRDATTSLHLAGTQIFASSDEQTALHLKPVVTPEAQLESMTPPHLARTQVAQVPSTVSASQVSSQRANHTPPATQASAVPQTLPPRDMLRYHRIINRNNLLLLLLIVLVILGSSTTYTVLYSFDIHQAAITSIKATTTTETYARATAVVHATITAEAKALATSISQETISTATNAYNTFVAANGVMFGFDAQGTNFNPYEHILSPANVSELLLDWTTSLKDENVANGSPVIGNNFVYTGSAQDSSSEAKLYAFDSKTGKILWTIEGLSDVSSPALANGIGYACVSQRSNDLSQGGVEAFNAKTGASLWFAQTGESADCAPKLVNGVVYVAWYQGVDALNAKTGSLLWSVLTSQIVSNDNAVRENWTLGSPAVANGIVYMGSGNHKLYAIDAKTGATLWTVSTDGPIASPIVANGIVYVTSDKLYAIDAKMGTILWTITQGGLSAVANGVGYVASGKKLYAIDAKTGTTLWAVSVCNQYGFSSTVINGLVFISCYNGKLYATNAKIGTILWSFTISDTIYSSPVVANGVIYVFSENGKLYAFHLPGLS